MKVNYLPTMKVKFRNPKTGKAAADSDIVTINVDDYDKSVHVEVKERVAVAADEDTEDTGDAGADSAGA